MSKFEAVINGKPVNLSLNVGRKIYGKQNGSDLGDLENGPMLKIWMDPEVLGQTIWHVYQDRIKEVAGVATEKEFQDMLDGETRRSIEAAFSEAISDFFTWGAALTAKIKDRLENLDKVMGQSLIPGHSSGSMPESSE